MTTTLEQVQSEIDKARAPHEARAQRVAAAFSRREIADSPQAAAASDIELLDLRASDRVERSDHLQGLLGQRKRLRREQSARRVAEQLAGLKPTEMSDDALVAELAELAQAQDVLRAKRELLDAERARRERSARNHALLARMSTEEREAFAADMRAFAEPK